MDKYLKLLPLGLFFVYGSKVLHSGAALADAPILLVLAGLAAFYEYKATSKLNEQFQNELDALKKSQESYTKDLEDVRGHVGSLKLGQNIRLTR